MENVYNRRGGEGMTVGVVDTTSIVKVMWLWAEPASSQPFHITAILIPQSLEAQMTSRGFPF